VVAFFRTLIIYLIFSCIALGLSITAYAGSRRSAANCILAIFLILVRLLIAHNYLLDSFTFQLWMNLGYGAGIETEATGR
jgi:hypothetical protein